MGDALPDVFDFGEGLYRGDTYVYTHLFNDDPLDWEPDTEYAVGDLTHASDEAYVPLTTVTYLGKPYTCLTDHVSTDTFDPTMWKADKKALGPETDISEYEFLGQYRTNRTATATLLGTDEFELITDGTDGALRRTLTADAASTLVPTQSNHKVEWDLQATLPDGVTVKTLLMGSPKITGDVTRA